MSEFNEYIYDGFIYKLYVPDGKNKGKDLPLVVMLHGCKQDLDQFAEETKMNQMAEKEKFLVLYPQVDRVFNPLFDNPDEVNIDGCWNWFLDDNQHRGTGLPNMLIGMIDDAEKRLKNYYDINLNRNRVYAVGLSAGGAMACILGVTYPDIFRGIAVCSGLPYDSVNTTIWSESWAKKAEYVMKNGVEDPFKCGDKAFEEMNKAYQKTEKKGKVAVIVFHGILDTRVHPINGQQVIIQWAQTYYRMKNDQGKANVTPFSVEAGIVKNGKSYTRLVYNNQNDTPIEMWLVHNMAHTWSGGSENGKYTDPLGPDATEIIWNFFEKDAR
jgi:poly(hydroxyalkanoate) depolymerase family esterase